MPNPIIVALDVPSSDGALRLAEQLVSVVGGFKIGSELFTSAGREVVAEIRRLGVPVFLDLKFHDIPNTVAKSVAAAVELDVQMLTVHCSGGLGMVEAAEQAAQETARKLSRTPPLILGVTVLTSLDRFALHEIGCTDDVGKQVERLTLLAINAGLRGLVCSPLEVAGLRQIVPPQFQLVTPGIRAETDAAGDQKRTLSASEALSAGANWLVIGRPICAAPDPQAAAQRILDSIPHQT